MQNAPLLVALVVAIQGIASSMLVSSYGQTTLDVRIEKVDFAFDVKPILSDKCFQCHGPDTEEVYGDLRLDIPTEDQDRDPAIVPGSKEDS